MVIETTGLADPAPVLQSIMGHPALVQAFRLDGVITLVDAVNGEATLDAHVEAVKQVAVADRIVLAKADLAADRRDVEALQSAAAAASIRAPRCSMPGQRRTGVAALFDCGLYDPATKTADVRRWLGEEAAAIDRPSPRTANMTTATTMTHEHRHDSRVRSFSLVA